MAHAQFEKRLISRLFSFQAFCRRDPASHEEERQGNDKAGKEANKVINHVGMENWKLLILFLLSKNMWFDIYRRCEAEMSETHLKHI